MALGRDIAAKAGRVEVASEPKEQIVEAEQALYKLGETGPGRKRASSPSCKRRHRCGQRGQRRLSARRRAGGHLDRPRRSGQEAGRPAPVRPSDPRRSPLDGQDLAGHQHRLQHRQGLQDAASCTTAAKARSTAASSASSVLEMSAEQLAARILSEASEVPVRTDPPRRHDRGRVPPLRRGRQGAGSLPALHRRHARPADQPARRPRPAAEARPTGSTC